MHVTQLQVVGRCDPYYRKQLRARTSGGIGRGGHLGDNWGTLETRGVASHLYYTLYYTLYFCITPCISLLRFTGIYGLFKSNPLK